MLRVLIVDDHPIVRQGLGQALGGATGMVICGEASTQSEALRIFEEKRPDVVVVDLSLKEGNGLDLIRELQAHHGQVRTLVFSMHDETLYAERSLRAGALGYIMKGQPMARVVEAINCVASGQVWLSEQMNARLLNQIVKRRGGDRAQGVESLTDRELEVYRLIGSGKGTREIAEMLHLSVKTIEGYNEQIKRKLGIRSVNELIRQAVVWVESGENLEGEQPPKTQSE